MERRNFIKNSVGAGIAGAASINGLGINQFFENPVYQMPQFDIPSPHNTKLVVKPIMTNMYHTAEWCGPCRFQIKTSEEEKAQALKSFDDFSNSIKSNTHKVDLSGVEMLDPGLVLFVEDFKITDEQYNKIDSDARKADVLLVSAGGSSIATYQIAKKYNKPVVLHAGLGCRTVDIAAYCRSNGVEAFIPDPYLPVAEILNLMRARKVFRQTRILYPTDWGWPSVASVAGINEPEKLKDMYGIELVKISYADLTAEMEKTFHNTQSIRESEEMAEMIYQNADKSFIDKKYIANSMQFQQSVINLMKKHNCNAFTIECFEFCCSRFPEKWNITPCLIHTLFKDMGIPSACEGDLGGLLGMQMLLAVSKKSPHMGNMFYKEKGKLQVNHSVPGIKMNGYDKPGLPYQLGRFTECGFGTKAVVDFMKNDEKAATVVRMNPTGNGLLVLKGQLVGSNGWGEDLLGCNVSAFIVGKDSGTAHTFMKKQADYGNHLCWVYGDYTTQLENLGEMLGINVVVES